MHPVTVEEGHYNAHVLTAYADVDDDDNDVIRRMITCVIIIV